MTEAGDRSQVTRGRWIIILAYCRFTAFVQGMDDGLLRALILTEQLTNRNDPWHVNSERRFWCSIALLH